VTPEWPPGRYLAAMLPEAHRRSALSGGTTLLLVILLVVLAVIGIPALAALGWPEIGLIVLALLILTWPALAFYAWARRRGDL
jgi:uncharacterized membrane protein YkvI